MKNRVLVLAGAVVLSAAAAAFCQTNPPPEPLASPPTLNQPSGTNALPWQNRSRPFVRPERIIGTLVRVDGTNLVIRTNQPNSNKTSEVTIPTDSRTLFQINGPRAKVTDLKPGMLMTVSTLGPQGHPTRQVVFARSTELDGTLVRTDGANLIVSVLESNGAPKEVTVATDAQTQVHFLGIVINGKPFPPREGTLAELQPGMRLKVQPATGPAEKITVMRVAERGTKP